MTSDMLDRRHFLKAGGIGVFGVLASRSLAWSNQARMIYIGTYTSGKSEGIYGYQFDPQSGALTRVNSIKSTNPSFLAIDRSKRYLYAVNEVGEYLGKPSGGVSAYVIERPNLNLRLLNEQATQGADPCHLSVDSKRKVLLVANQQTTRNYVSSIVR